MESARSQQRRQWICQQLGLADPAIERASEDASFRSYWRVRDSQGHSYVVMDAPPDKEDCRPFVAIAAKLTAAGLHAPQIHAHDLQQGFLLLEDLGDTLFADQLNEQSADGLYQQAFDAMARMRSIDADDLPAYDRDRLSIEMELFPNWFVQRQLGGGVDDAFQDWWQPLVELLLASAAEQPRCFVHRDYHCGNLMVAEPAPGILDFQDAVCGPIAYDLVSLLFDRYISWPRERIVGWAEQYRQLAAPAVDPGQWLRWVDLMAVQRNLKVMGIFARLNLRDAKPRYLQWQPRFAGYLADTAGRYPELSGLARFIAETALPRLDAPTAS